MNLKQNILILSCAALLSGCGGGTGSSTNGITNPSNKAIQSGQITDNTTGEPLVNVKVSIGNESTTTDVEGYYTLSNLTANKEVVVNFEKEGYLLGSTEIKLKALSDDNKVSPNHIEFTMHVQDYTWEQESTKEIASPRISINAFTAYNYMNGNPFNGSTVVSLTILDNNEQALLTNFPGGFKGINTNGSLVQFKSYGLINIEVKDINGDILQLAQEETATLVFKQESSSEKLDTIPMWYYDYDQGLWVEEGYAQLQEDGTYKGEISHLGTWALNKPLEEDPGIYRGRIIDENGTPVGDVRVYAIGKNWVSSDLTTDENGIFELKVIPGDDFELTAYDYQDKFGASYNNTIAAVASGDVVED